MTAPKHPSSQNVEIAGLSLSDKPAFLVVGKLRRPHGLRGEMKMTVLTDFPQLLVKGQEVFVGEEYQPLKIQSVRWQTEEMLIAFEEYFDRDEVGVHRNEYLFMSVEDFPLLPEGEYYFYQLIGLKVICEDGQELGTLVDLLETGANNVYIVRNAEGKESLLPAIKEVILSVDLEKREMRVHLMPGLL
ncbi:MAG: 16S rRNA processing protein RimM [Chloroflexota bacterium]|nr:MAG: 16S rRNA processing protein RimM [Chloroflexota bacterium]